MDVKISRRMRVPIPDVKRPGRPPSKLSLELSALDIGEMVEVTGKKQRHLTAIVAVLGKRTGRKFLTRKLREEGEDTVYGVWRVS